MTDLEKCNAEIKASLEKYGCTLKVCALLETEGIKFKVDTVYARKRKTVPQVKGQEG